MRKERGGWEASKAGGDRRGRGESHCLSLKLLCQPSILSCYNQPIHYGGLQILQLASLYMYFQKNKCTSAQAVKGEGLVNQDQS